MRGQRCKHFPLSQDIEITAYYSVQLILAKIFFATLRIFQKGFTGMTPQEKIRANAELVRRELGQTSEMDNFGYNAESVAWLDGFIERQRLRAEFADETAIERMSQMLGSFIGECVIACYGGEWKEQEGSWAVDFGGGNAAYPFNKVRKQFLHGGEDSVQSWFETIPLIFTQQLDAQPPPLKKPWWKFGR